MARDLDSQFMQLYVQNQGRVYRYILTLVAHESDAEELFGAVSMALWEDRRQFDPARGAFAQWAFGYAINHVRNHIRKRARRGEGRYLSDEALGRLAEIRSDFDEAFEARREALGHCLDQLPAKQRRVIETYYDGDATIPALAEQFGLSAEALYKQLQRIRRALFTCINRLLDQEGAA